MGQHRRKSKSRSAPHRRRYTRRRVLNVLAGLIVALALVLADRMGVFGTSGDGGANRGRSRRQYRPDSEAIRRHNAADMLKYHNKTFSVDRVVDGDTLDVSVADTVVDKETTRIRLWGVDTPETVKPNTPKEHFGSEASEFTKHFCTGRTVRLELVKKRNTRDKYGRLLAYVSDSQDQADKCLNAELIRQGYGYNDPRYSHPRKAEFAQLQQNARRGRLGLWAKVRRSDLPHYYREGKFELGQ